MNQNLRVALVWNGTVFQEKTFNRVSGDTISVGESRVNDFTVPADGLPETFEMFKRTSGGYTFRLTDALSGKIHYNDEDHTVEELLEVSGITKAGSAQSAAGKSVNIYEGSLSPGDWGVIQLGDVSIFFQFVDNDAAVLYRPPFNRDMMVVSGTILFAFLAHFIFLLVCELSYDPNVDRANLEIPDRFVQFIAEDVDEPIEEEEELEEPEEDTTGKKAGGEEGKFGDPDTDIPESKVPKSDGEMVDKIDVKNIGINKALGANVLGSGPLKNLFGSSEGFDAKMQVAMSGEGNTLVVGRGAGGMGMRGTGRGGGGEGFGRVQGMGKVDTGGGKGVKAKIGGKGKAKVKAKVSRGAARVGSFCEKGNIRSVVGRGTGGVRYCYEKALQTNPTLSGKVIVNWTVNMSGGVMKAFVSSSTLGNPGVESCITRVVQRWRFAPPKGGNCVISYPFIFKGAQ
ncbi:MAG: AgmX/PglI C-terminal domain-containing protein [Myxococcota bacterium]